MNETLIQTIVGGIVAIAGLIFVKKTKRKITRRKQKDVDTKNNINSNQKS